jgi:hypothetical protein
MKTRDLLILAAVAFVLYLLVARKSGASAGAGAGSGTGGGIYVDPWAQRIDAATDALGGLWNIGKGLFGGGSSSGGSSGYPVDVTDYNPNAPADPTGGTGAISFDE